MPLRFLACLSIVAALIAAPAAAEAAGDVRPGSVSRTSVLSAGTSTVTLRCPAPSVAVNAAVVRKSAGVTVRRSIPGRNADDWRFRLSARDDGSRVRSVLRCVRLELPDGVGSARLEVKTRRSVGVSVPAGATVAARVRCGRAWLATGHAFDPGGTGNVRLAAAVPSAHGWRFVLENIGSTRATAGVSARCLRQRVTAGGGSAELTFRARRPSRANAFGPARRVSVSHGCGPGLFSLATGFRLDPAEGIELATTGPARSGRGRWTFLQQTPANRARTFLVCLSRNSEFG